MGRPRTEFPVDDWARQYRTGMSTYAIAAAHGDVSQVTVRKLLVAAGVEMRLTGNKTKDGNQIDRAEVRRLRGEGLRMIEIARRLGVSKSAIVQILAAPIVAEDAPKREFWSAADDATLTDLYNAGGDHGSIAIKMGRTYGSVKNRSMRLGLRRADSSTREAIEAEASKRREAIKAMLGEGVTFAEMATRLGVTVDQVNHTWRSLKAAGAVHVRGKPKISPAAAARARRARQTLAAKARDAAKPQKSSSAAAVASIMATKPGFGHKDTARAAAFSAAMAHANRVAALPPVDQTEAERLVAEFLARRSVTVCPSPASFEGNLGVQWGPWL